MIMPVLLRTEPIDLSAVPPEAKKPPSNPFLGKLGNRLRLRREDRDLTLDELSTLSDISGSTISAIERGQKNAGISTIARLVQVLELDFAALMRDLPEPPPPKSRGRMGPPRRTGHEE
ncbi:helix-turn-helix domain-containing protein [Amycolatopsis sp. GM8]|uniref:helix-turn-helix domain-containing protein n=1 Tax=Amycolatopsis sp. GM8 TaxID=2896530 RepID=UPI001F2C6F41|nr:helix-turn-helix transcriptional regulator [Amycolatopsis sp. GM8]